GTTTTLDRPTKQGFYIGPFNRYGGSRRGPPTPRNRDGPPRRSPPLFPQGQDRHARRRPHRDGRSVRDTVRCRHGHDHRDDGPVGEPATALLLAGSPLL